MIMKLHKLFEKTYNLNGTEFFDYGTEDVNNQDLFDIHKTGMSFYDDLINNPDYMRKNKNLTSKIVYMTPKEYFTEVGKIFGNNANKQIQQTKRDISTIDFLEKVIKVSKKKFPLSFIDYANNGQEGRHRMYTAAMLTSWDTKFPVLVVDYYDKDLQKEIDNRKEQDRLYKLIREAVSKALQYKYKDDNEFKDEVEYQLSIIFNKEVTAKITRRNDDITVSAENGSYTFDISEIKYKEDSDDSDDIDIDTFDDDSIDDWLKQHNIDL